MSRRTKIVATVGPASWDETVMRRLIQAGVNVFRFNFSHAKHEQSAELFAQVRRLAKEEDRNIAILMDLQGPRIRTGKIDPAIGSPTIELTAGQEVKLVTEQVPVSSAAAISVDYPELPLDVKPGDKILMEDGLFELRVLNTEPQHVECTVITGGDLGSNKGINVPGVTLSVDTITEKDITDLKFGVEQGVDFVALSFVRRGEDVVRLKELIREFGAGKSDHELPLVISKIEKHEAITNFEEILDASDAIMVARGDLGVEMPTERVPILQKEIIRKCNYAGKPVITATQMLDSMIRNPRPTRAEASDVANAIYDGTDAVMLSGESANGHYPLQAVQTMARIAVAAEEESYLSKPFIDRFQEKATSITDAISQAASAIGYEVQAVALVTTTTSGYTARMVSRNRPTLPIYAITHSPLTLRKLALVWGVEAFLCDRYSNTDEMLLEAEEVILKHGKAKAGEIIVITAGVPIGTPGRSNLIKVRVVGEHRPE
jgi:pyruvate kinase